jgi:hypothetical protein
MVDDQHVGRILDAVVGGVRLGLLARPEGKLCLPAAIDRTSKFA